MIRDSKAPGTSLEWEEMSLKHHHGEKERHKIEIMCSQWLFRASNFTLRMKAASPTHFKAGSNTTSTAVPSNMETN